MEHHLRLADRRGLLKGRALSRPQAYATEVLMVSEDRAKAQSFMDQLKLSVVSHDPAFWLDRLFPQWAAKKESEDTESEPMEEDFDLNPKGPTEWHFPPVDPAEVDAMLAELLAKRNQGTVTVDELEDEGWV